jgi:hypothetical protein
LGSGAKGRLNRAGIKMIFVINLDTSKDRLAAFAATNQHLTFERFAAVDGHAFDLVDLQNRGLIEPGAETVFSRSNLGCAMSHRALWKIAARRAAPTTIFEDDAIAHVRPPAGRLAMPRRLRPSRASPGIEKLPSSSARASRLPARWMLRDRGLHGLTVRRGDARGDNLSDTPEHSVVPPSGSPIQGLRTRYRVSCGFCASQRLCQRSATRGYEQLSRSLYDSDAALARRRQTHRTNAPWWTIRLAAHSNCTTTSTPLAWTSR